MKQIDWEEAPGKVVVSIGAHEMSRQAIVTFDDGTFVVLRAESSDDHCDDRLYIQSGDLDEKEYGWYDLERLGMLKPGEGQVREKAAWEAQLAERLERDRLEYVRLKKMFG